VLYVTDGVGGRSQMAHRTGIERLRMLERFRPRRWRWSPSSSDWAGPLAGPALDVIYWYFSEVPKHTDLVGRRRGRESRRRKTPRKLR